MTAPSSAEGRPKQIGEFAVQRVIGEGGMGIVYEATERLSGRRVALKLLRSSLTGNEAARDRFFAEMRVMARLEHPSIVRSLACSEIDGQLVLVLEYLEGRTLREELAGGALSTERAVSIAIAVASALSAAHEMSSPIVHRDLKPENLMLLADGGVKVMDFGVAKVLTPDSARTMALVGTAQYMSPEQGDAGAITPQSDLYALGLIVYEMLTGHPPFRAASPFLVLKQHRDTPPPPLAPELRRTLPAALETLLFQLLAKAPADRPPSARATLAALQALRAPAAGNATVSLPARPNSGAPRIAPAPAAAAQRAPQKLDTIALLDRFEKKRRWPMIAIGVAAAIGAAAFGVAVWLSGSGDSRAARTKAPADPSSVPSAATPAPTANAPCPGGKVCAPFAPPNPARVVAETIIEQGERFARQLAPNAVLGGARFDGVIAGGAIDLTLANGAVMLSFNVPPAGGIIIDVDASQLRAMQFAQINQAGVVGPRQCSLQAAFDAAVRGGMPVSSAMRISLHQATGAADPTWVVMSEPENAMVSGRTCVVSGSTIEQRKPRR